MPKTKPAEALGANNVKPSDELEKIIEIDTDDKEIDVELLPGEEADTEDPEDDAGLDEEEIDPFKDKWEE